ncbi:trypsin-like serine protease [Kinneretia aquatilis]|uniref:trypsin-like serine protease n=1 Tax=Kinneretia aquatilis TaxID=2070761 RepID=UPI0014951867|nr:trypsin-like serine protease [Paucibacter aquatile]WIV99661.1 trypsin-like serine protease [Paucibacter aquatile]
MTYRRTPRNTPHPVSLASLSARLTLAASLGLLAGGSFAQTAASGVAAKPDEATPQIVGGTVTTPYSRPYQVALLMNGRQGCGGTLISPNWVLTAAHCVDGASTASLTVQVGAHSISRRDGQNIRVSQIISHENWRGAQGIRSGWDIAVLRLASPAPANITPAKLPTAAIESQIAGVGRYVTVSGWGLTSNGGSPSDVLREVNLPVLSNSACSSEMAFNLPASVICGGGTGGVSACNGDSGGPFAASANGKFYSIGTVSWGNSCRGATVFTRTSSYLDWIAQRTGVRPDTDVPPDQAPVARFNATVTGLNVVFSDASTDDKGISRWAWNFGDGSSSTQASPNHAYASAGSYTVTLTVTDTANQSNTSSQVLRVGGGGDTGCGGVAAWSATKLYAIRDVVSYKGKKYQAIWWSQAAQPDIYSNVWSAQGSCN